MTKTSKKIIEKLKEKNLQYLTSWALYNVTEEDFDTKIKKSQCSIDTFRDNLEALINRKAIILGLNVSERNIDIKTKADTWTNFHDTTRYSQDFNIPYMFFKTKYEGCYMTDLYKNLPLTKASQIKKELKTYPDIEKESLETFQFEYDLIQPDTLICFGQKVYDELKRQMDSNKLQIKPETNIITIEHYANPIKGQNHYKEERKKLL